MRFPLKPALTGALAIALVAAWGFDRSTVASLWDIPMPKPAEERGVSIEEVRAKRMEMIAHTYLIDPNRTLDGFYDALLKGGTTRVAHYGDSPTTGDLITADARALLQQQFGNAGTGFVLVAKPWAWYNHRGVEMQSSGWRYNVAGVATLPDSLYGLGAVSFRGNAGAVARWTLADGTHTRAEVYFLAQPGGGKFSFEANGATLGVGDTDGEQSGPGFISFDLPEGSKEFTLKVTDGEVRLYGVDFRRNSPGVVYSSIGVNGANITLIARALDTAHWTAELNHYKPDLLVLAYGTNESGFPDFVNGNWAGELRVAVKKAKAALPGVSILLMSPMDRGVRGESGEIQTIASLPKLVSLEEGVARELNVAFFNTYQAMGGEGTMGRWYTAEPRLVGADFIHPLPAGAKVVGGLLYKALRDGFQDYKLRQLGVRN